MKSNKNNITTPLVTNDRQPIPRLYHCRCPSVFSSVELFNAISSGRPSGTFCPLSLWFPHETENIIPCSRWTYVMQWKIDWFNAWRSTRKQSPDHAWHVQMISRAANPGRLPYSRLTVINTIFRTPTSTRPISSWDLLSNYMQWCGCIIHWTVCGRCLSTGSPRRLNCTAAFADL